MKTLERDTDLLSLGKLCEIFQVSPGTLHAAIARANVRPVLRLNGLAYYADADVEAIRAKLPKRAQL